MFHRYPLPLPLKSFSAFQGLFHLIKYNINIKTVKNANIDIINPAQLIEKLLFTVSSNMRKKACCASVVREFRILTRN